MFDSNRFPNWLRAEVWAAVNMYQWGPADHDGIHPYADVFCPWLESLEMFFEDDD